MRGVAAFLLQNYVKARALLENSLTEKGAGSWRTTHYYLGWCNLKISDDENLSFTEKALLLDKAEKYFLKLQDDDQALLALEELGRQRKSASK